MSQHFQNILKEAGGKTVQYFEHIEVNYTRGDLKKVEACPPPLYFQCNHIQGKRWELQKVSATFSETVEKLSVGVFEGKKGNISDAPTKEAYVN